jgi:hypothetical protein
MVLDYYDATSVQSTAETLRAFLLSGVKPLEELSSMIRLFNHAIGASTTSHEHWMPLMNKPSSTSTVNETATFYWILADRLSTGLARMRLLDYSKVREGVSHSVLNMHLLKSGMWPQLDAELSELQELFLNKVPASMTKLADLPEHGEEHTDRRSTDVIQSAATLSVSASNWMAGADVQLCAVKLDAVPEIPLGVGLGVNLSQATREQLETALSAVTGSGVPAGCVITPRKTRGNFLYESLVPPSRKETMAVFSILRGETQKRPRQPEFEQGHKGPSQSERELEAEARELQERKNLEMAKGLSMTAEIQRQVQIALGSLPVGQGSQGRMECRDLGETVVDLTGLGPAQSAGDLKQDAEKTALFKAVMQGGMLSGQASSRSRSGMKLQENERWIRDSIATRKLANPVSVYELEFNTILDQYAAQAVKCERIDAIRSMSNLTETERLALNLREEAARHDMDHIHKQRAILEEILLQQSRGKSAVAEEMARFMREENQGFIKDPDAERLLKKAKVEAKEVAGHALMQAVQAQGSALTSLAGAMKGTNQGQVRQQQVTAPVGAVVQQQQSNGRGRANATNSHTIRWVDASVYDTSVAGKQAPAVGSFIKNSKFYMDAPGTRGIINNVQNCSRVCTGCSQVGHQFTECPAREWQLNGLTYVNWRWLFDKGFCTAEGFPSP